MNKSNVKSFPMTATARTYNGYEITSATNRRGCGSISKHSIHAEEFLVRKMRKLRCLERFGFLSVRVERYAKDGSLRMARPCTRCFNLLKDYGVREIIYTTPERQWKEERL